MNSRSIPQGRLGRIKRRARVPSDTHALAAARAYMRGRSTAEIAIRQPAHPGDGIAERRQTRRVATTSEVLVRRIGGFNFNVALTDISTGGCRVQMLEPSEIGDPVIARLPQLEPLGSRVRWAEGTTTGVQFLTRIHPAVFDLLLTRLQTAERACQD